MHTNRRAFPRARNYHLVTCLFLTLFFVSARYHTSTHHALRRITASLTPRTLSCAVSVVALSSSLCCAVPVARASSLSCAIVVDARSSSPRRAVLVARASSLSCAIVVVARSSSLRCAVLVARASSLSCYARLIRPRNVVSLVASMAFVIKSASISSERTRCALTMPRRA